MIRCNRRKTRVYNPKFNGTFNHDALEYMLQELTQNGIQVMLVATHHPYVVKPRFRSTGWFQPHNQ